MLNSPIQTFKTHNKQRNRFSGELAILCLTYLCSFGTLHLLLTSRDSDSLSAEMFRLYFNNKNQNKVSSNPKEASDTSIPGQYIVFYPMGTDQGYGNTMAGLLAAHLFGVEFRRTVCLSSTMSSFLSAFEPVDHNVIQECSLLLQNLPPPTTDNSLTIINYISPPNECVVQEKLSNTAIPVIHLRANTYPRWPSVPNNFFLRFYRPRDSFLRLLPYDSANPPEMVVHLRMPDGGGDQRVGLDQRTFRALGDALPRNATYLVTNSVPWFDFFARRYGWQHPNWKKVTHSAGFPTQDWGTRKVSNSKPVRDEQEEQRMQVWVDWYTILRAKTVYHTHSDFSISAIHWMNIMNTKYIDGTKQVGFAYQLKLLNETWRQDGETEPLIQRTKNAIGTKRLRLCEADTIALLDPIVDANVTLKTREFTLFG